MKKCVIVSAVTALATIALIVIVISGIKIVPSLFLTEEERVLRDFMGEYTVTGFARVVNGATTTMPIPRGGAPVQRASCYIFTDHSATLLRANMPVNSQSNFYRTSPLKYHCVKVDSAKKEGLHNLITNEQFHKPTNEDVYAIFVYTPDCVAPELSDSADEYYKKSGHGAIYYVVGNKYYVSTLTDLYENYELKKVV